MKQQQPLMTPAHLPRLYTDSEVAESLQCSRATIRNLRISGKLSCVTVANKHYFTANGVREYLGMPAAPEDLMPAPRVFGFPAIPILSKADLLALADPIRVSGTGVYFLWLAQELIYIGQSESVSHRVAEHRKACEGFFARSMEFDAATAMAIEWPYHLAVEAAYIRAYGPVGNKKP